MDNYQNASKIDISVKSLLKPSQRLIKTDKSCFYLNSIDLSNLDSNQVASKSFSL